MRLLNLLLALALFISCSPQENQVNPGKKTEPSLSYKDAVRLADVTPLMKERAEAFTKASQNADGSQMNCAYVYSATVTKYESAPSKLAARLFLLGYKGVYLSAGSARMKSCSEFIRSFIYTSSLLGMKVYAACYEDNKILVSESRAAECLNLVLDYNRMVTPMERYAGIAADLEPHTVKMDLGNGLVWNTQENMGAGNANDQLLGLTQERLASAGSALHSAGLELQEALWCNNQKYFNEGKLPNGHISRFTRVCDKVTLMAYSSTTDKIWAMAEQNLEAADRQKSVSICIKTSTNGEASTSIFGNGWDAMLETLSTLRARASAYSCFCGLDMFKYESLETMWESAQ